MSAKRWFILAVLVLSASPCFAQRKPASIGAKMTIAYPDEQRQLMIMGVAPGTPAARAGLTTGQIIRAVDGIPTDKLQLIDCVALIRGEVGTKVKLLIESRSGRTNTVELVREIVAAEALDAALNSTQQSTNDCDWENIPVNDRPKGFVVNSNQTVRIQSTNGSRAFIQFTQFGTTNAHYRWRFHLNDRVPMVKGVGVVFADYDRRVDAYGVHHLTPRHHPDDETIKAGDFRLRWSDGGFANGSTNAFLYYVPSRERLEILDANAFDSADGA